MTSNALVVKSHVARDLLQCAALFKTDRLVAWEYVSNSLQYVDAGSTPNVTVTLDLRKKCIEVVDNGAGMDQQGLQNFFVMHGENRDRKAGRSGRGKFGTGKSAAFGIGDRLRVTTVRHCLRNSVELTRRDIEAAGAGAIPIKVIETDVLTKETNGTCIQILDIKLRKFDVPGIMKFIERHLAHWPNRPTVIVNGHECEYAEPAFASEERVLAAREDTRVLGSVAVRIRVAKAPLDSEQQGIAIFCNGVWLESTLAGAEGQKMSQYIFGDIDVPALDNDSSSIPPYDMSRSMQLNRNNRTVMCLMSFIGREVDRVRRQLAREDQQRRAREESKRLAREADSIALMINEDFQEFSNRVARVKAKSGSGRDFGERSVGSSDGDEELVEGGTVPASATSEDGAPGRADGHSGDNGKAPQRGPILEESPTGEKSAKRINNNGNSRRPAGGFSVDFRAMGADEVRARYNRQERAILVNLDHPQIIAARGGANTEDPTFRRLAYEVAFSEYAIALASELAEQEEYIEPSEPIFDIRETINRMARRAAPLYAEGRHE